MRTREERLAYQRKYYQAHKKEIQEYQREYQKRYRVEHRDRINELSRECFAKNPESHRRAAARWKAKNPNYYREWLAKNKDRVNARRRYLRKYDPFVNAKDQERKHIYYLKNRDRILEMQRIRNRIKKANKEAV